MASIQVPMVSAKFYTQPLLNAGLAAVNDVIKTYGKTIETISRLTGVIEEVIYSFIWVESGGDRWATTGRFGRPLSNFVGLMQIDASASITAIFLANKMGLLTPDLSKYLVGFLGQKTLDCILTMKNQSLPNCRPLITQKQLIDSPELNILCGSIYIMVLSKRYIENGTIRLDKVIVAYNRGINVESRVFPMQNLSPEQVYSQVLKSNMTTQNAKITQVYISKIVGPSGMLTALINPQKLSYA